MASQAFSLPNQAICIFVQGEVYSYSILRKIVLA